MKIESIATAIKKNRVINKIIYFQSIDSTNKYLLENDFASGTIVAAKVQTAGRGRQGAKWISGKGGLWFSFVINKKIINPYMLVIISSVALVETLAQYNLKPLIKWPNDILIKSKKISGILIENDYYNGRIVIGIGININNKLPKDLYLPVTSIKKQLGKKIDEEEFFTKLIQKLDWYLFVMNKQKKQLIGKWVKKQVNLTGKKVNIVINNKRIAGTIRDVHKDGAISIIDEQGKLLKTNNKVFFI